MYYRRPKGTGADFHCRRKTVEGECYAICGENREHSIFGSCECAAPCVSDLAVALTAYGAQLETMSAAGSRSLSVPDLFAPLGKTLKPDEVITGIVIPEQPGSATASFQKFRIRKAIDFAIVSTAAVIATKDSVVTDARIAVGSVAYAPYRDHDAEQFLIGRSVTEETASIAAGLLVSKAKPLEKNSYKVQITRALVTRAILGEGM